MTRFVVITSSPDPHVEMVQKHLDEEFTIFDPMSLMLGDSLSYELAEGQFMVRTTDNDLSSCSLIWYRKPTLPAGQELPVLPRFRPFTLSAYTNTVKAMYSLLAEKVWVSDVWAILRANSKPLQLELASRVGFNVPRTLITSSKDVAARFIREVGRVITKPMGTEHIEFRGQAFAVYTTTISALDDFSLEGLHIAPAIFQQAIEPALHLRVTIMGNQAWTCSIKWEYETEENIDWRMGIAGGLIYQSYNLPPALVEKCVEINKLLGTKFGAFDLILDKQGQYWFIEVNPNGQWGFVEEETGLPLSKAMATYFRQLVTKH
jgi:glutathione synthase/RimK-type ligase-like ATP-grasp enzyme